MCSVARVVVSALLLLIKAKRMPKNLGRNFASCFHERLFVQSDPSPAEEIHISQQKAILNGRRRYVLGGTKLGEKGRVSRWRHESSGMRLDIKSAPSY